MSDASLLGLPTVGALLGTRHNADAIVLEKRYIISTINPGSDRDRALLLWDGDWVSHLGKIRSVEERDSILFVWKSNSSDAFARSTQANRRVIAREDCFD